MTNITRKQIVIELKKLEKKALNLIVKSYEFDSNLSFIQEELFKSYQGPKKYVFQSQSLNQILIQNIKKLQFYNKTRKKPVNELWEMVARERRILEGYSKNINWQNKNKRQALINFTTKYLIQGLQAIYQHIPSLDGDGNYALSQLTDTQLRETFLKNIYPSIAGVGITKKDALKIINKVIKER